MTCFSLFKLNLLIFEQTRLINAVVYLFLSFGCFYQILDICQLYYEYPTNVFIETNFNSDVNSFQAITLCTQLKPSNDGFNSTYALDKVSKLLKGKFINNLAIRRAFEQLDVTDEYLNNSIERISYDRYCISFNSKKSGTILLTIIPCLLFENN